VYVKFLPRFYEMCQKLHNLSVEFQNHSVSSSFILNSQSIENEKKFQTTVKRIFAVTKGIVNGSSLQMPMTNETFLCRSAK
jgi:hypothetical protein